MIDDFFSSEIWLAYHLEILKKECQKLQSGFVAVTNKFGIRKHYIFANNSKEIANYLKSVSKIVTLQVTVNNYFSRLDNPISNIDNFKLDSLIVNLEDFGWRQISESHRRNIRKAQNLGVQIVNQPDIKTARLIFAFWKETYTRKKIPFAVSEDTFVNLLKINTFSPGSVKMYVARINDKPVCGAVIIAYNKTVYYLNGGSIDLGSGSPHLLHYQIIQEHKEQGYRYYHMGSGRAVDSELSDVHNVHEFKRRLGAQKITCYFYAEYTNLLLSKLSYLTRLSK